MKPFGWKNLAAVLLLSTLAGVGPAARADEPYARSRDYDLQNARMRLRFDTAQKKVMGEVTHTLTTIRDDLTALEFDSVDLTIHSVTVGGKPAEFAAPKGKLRVQLDRPAQRGTKFTVHIRYEGQPKKGLYFILPDKNYPDRPLQVWTQGQTEDTRYYIPIYDYPNDQTATEMILTVPAEWITVSNGRLVSVKPEAGGMKTWHWQQSQPHAAYLISIVAGQFEESKETWRGKPVTYYAPKGRGDHIAPTFRNTPKMLEFFSTRLGVPYPWDKYAQSTVDDFVAGGMENTSATTNTAGSLVHPKLASESLQNADGLIAHELGHQWFGDLVTTKDWGNVWLNESFANLMDQLWEEHHYGADELAYSLWQEQNQWFQQQNLFGVPIVTYNFETFVEVAGNVYGKGSLVLQMLRHELGDAAFFPALQRYLTKNRHQNVVTADLIRAIEEATGRNMDPFFQQWVYRAGAPRFEVSYAWDESVKQVKMEVKQLQKVEGLVGLFRVATQVEITTASGKKSFPVTLSKAGESFSFDLPERPLLVLLDPGNRILKRVEFKKDTAEWLYQLKSAATVPDRCDAARALGAIRGNDEVLAALAATAGGDKFWGVRVQAIQALGRIGSAGAQMHLLAALANEQPWVRQQAVTQLGSYRDDAAIGERLEKIFREDPAYRVRAAALSALARVKTKNAFPVLQEAAGMDSPDDRIRIAALQAMGPLADPQAVPILMKWASTGRPLNVRQTAIQGLGSLDRGNKEVTRALIGYLQQPYLGVRFATIFALGQRGDAEAAGPLTTLLETGEVPEILRSIVQAQVNRLRAAGQRAAQPAGGAGQPAAAQPPEAPAQTQAPAAGGDTASLQQMGAQILQMLEKLQKETADINERLKKLEARMPEKK